MICRRTRQSVGVILSSDLSRHVTLCDDHTERPQTLLVLLVRWSECEHNKCQQTTGAGANTGVSGVMVWCGVVWCGVVVTQIQRVRRHGVMPS